MVRSMYSGVSGLRTHQTRMDTIGNNIANVNTYGFKSGRTTFRDIYYQNMTNASAPTGAAGGVNPSQVGYGSKVGSVDVMMGRSTFTMTDQGMDVAIDGDGFIQVQDAAGNMFYTRAGMLNFDSAGNLVDMQGNYVLGVNGDPTGRAPASERISVALPNVQPTASSMEATINGKRYTVKSSNNTNAGNLNLTFSADSSMTDGNVTADITPTGINVKFSPEITYNTMADFNNAINDAIKAANGGKEHPAGRFTIAAVGHDPFVGGAMTAEEICGTNYGIKGGEVAVNSSGNYFGGLNFSGKVGSEFSANGAMGDFDVNYANGKFEYTVKIGSDTYKGEVDSSKTSSGKFNLYKNGVKSNDYIEMERPSFNEIVSAWRAVQDNPNGQKATFDYNGGDFSGGNPYTIDGHTINVPGGTPAGSDSVDAIVEAFKNLSPTNYVAKNVGGNLVLEAKEVGKVAANPITSGQSPVNPVWGVDVPDINATPGNGGWPGQNGFDDTVDLSGVGTAKASAPSRDLGFSGTSFALRNGTGGGPQSIADMTGINIGPNGVITGLDSVGAEIVIGRIDLATFANPAGLYQSGSSYFTVSTNSGVPVLSTPGQDGAGQLVTGSLELSNVDLSREFSDMISTQRGYQANSRIITVSDTMMEELINLKR